MQHKIALGDRKQTEVPSQDTDHPGPGYISMEKVVYSVSWWQYLLFVFSVVYKHQTYIIVLDDYLTIHSNIQIFISFCIFSFSRRIHLFGAKGWDPAL